MDQQLGNWSQNKGSLIENCSLSVPNRLVNPFKARIERPCPYQEEDSKPVFLHLATISHGPRKSSVFLREAVRGVDGAFLFC